MLSSRKLLAVALLVLARPALARVPAPGAHDMDIWCAGPVSFEDCVDKSGNWLATTDDTENLGTSALRWHRAFVGTGGLTFGDGSTQLSAAGSGVWGVNGPIIYYTGGNVGIGIATAAATLDVEGTSQFGTGANKSTFSTVGWLTMNPGARITLTGATGLLTSQSSVTTTGAFFGDGSHLTGISGSVSGGTANVIPKWTSANTLGLSLLTESASSDTFTGPLAVQPSSFSVGGNSFVVTNGLVGIGHTTPVYTLDFAYPTATSSYVRYGQFSDISAVTLGFESSTVAQRIISNLNLALGAGSSDDIIITPSGNVAIGQGATVSSFTAGGGLFMASGSSITLSWPYGVLS